MSAAKRGLRLRTRLVLWLVGSFVVGSALLIASIAIRPPAPVRTGVSASATPDTRPAAPPRPSQKEAAARSLSGLLLLFSMLALSAGVISAAWLVVDIRRGRPAWQRQTKYPKRG